MYSRGKDGQAPVHCAALKGHLEFFIKELNCDPKVVILGKSFRGRVLLHDAAQRGHLGIVKFLVEEEKCNPSHLDKNAMTPLHMAAMCGHMNIVTYLTLEQHCDPL